MANLEAANVEEIATMGDGPPGVSAGGKGDEAPSMEAFCFE